MVTALLFMLGLGTTCGLILSVASRVFYVYEDPRIEQVEECLAGANCGGCGYAGCGAAAVAVVAGKAPPNVCIVGGPDCPKSVSEIMGIEAGVAEPATSENFCTGGKRAFLAIHNCSWCDNLLPLELNPAWGLPRGESWDLYRWYPDPARLQGNTAAFGAKAEIALRPFETVLLEDVPRVGEFGQPKSGGDVGVGLVTVDVGGDVEDSLGHRMLP